MMFLLGADLLSVSFCTFEFQHHKNKFLFGWDGKVVRGTFKVRLFNKAIAACCPHNYPVDVLGALNGNALTIG
jgi:hypothetical protein